MDVIDAIRARTSVRSYSDEPVPEESMERILEAARLAPSAMNYQPWHFVVVKDRAKREELSRGRYAKFLRESPVVVVGCGDRKRSPHWYAVDVTIAMQNMVLAATAQGLGTCWIGSFDEGSVKEAVGVPEHMAVVAMLSVGYPKKKLDLAALLAGSKSRKKMEDIVSYESF